MHYITDYQLDIKKGFQCRVNGKMFHCSFAWSSSKKLYYVSYLLKVADAMEIPRQEFIGIFNSDCANDVLYCKSEQECYDLCQIIVKTYFKPADIERDIISIRCGKESYKFELKILAGKYVWENTVDRLKYIVNKSQIDLAKLREELNIKIYNVVNLGYLGFDSREDALKFAKWVKTNLYSTPECEEFKQSITKYYIDDEYIVNNTDKKEVCEKSREHLKHYYHGTEQVNFPNRTFILKQFRAREYFWSGANPNVGSKDLYKQFELSADQTLAICNKLKLHAYFIAHTLLFGDRKDAIKFTDYLIETYIIKKEKTYDTNQLRKERTAISRGAKPAGSIIHGRRSKASVRCGCIEHKACLGS